MDCDRLRRIELVRQRCYRAVQIYKESNQPDKAAEMLEIIREQQRLGWPKVK